LPRSANLRTAATLICLAADRGDSSAKGATPMTTPNRLKRYNDHITIVRALEVQGGAK
jgi:hypothetical protein